MQIKTVQWNIGGGKIRDPQSNAEDDSSYSRDGIQHITDIIKRIEPDIVSFQETHSDGKTIQAKIFAESLRLPHFINDIYDISHIDSSQNLGQAILSKFPITDHSFELFLNPKLTVVRPDGSRWTSHEKGISRCILKINNTLSIEFMTLHCVPYRKFNADLLSDALRPIRDDAEAKIKPRMDISCIIQGDFNIDSDSLTSYFPLLFSFDIKEAAQHKPTAPDGRIYDHVLFRKLELVSMEVITTALTDHYPIVSIFATV